MKIRRNIFYENWIKIDPYTQHELINIKNTSFWQQHAVLGETSTHTPKQVSWLLPISDKIESLNYRRKFYFLLYSYQKKTLNVKHEFVWIVLLCVHTVQYLGLKRSINEYHLKVSNIFEALRAISKVGTKKPNPVKLVWFSLFQDSRVKMNNQLV